MSSGERIRRATCIFTCACACLLPLGVAAGAENEVAQARKAFVEAMKIARKQRRAAPAQGAVQRVRSVARKLRTEAALNLLRDVAIETPHPYQRVYVLSSLASLEAKPAEPRLETAMRLAEAARAHSLDIRPTNFLTPNWTVEEAMLGNAGIAEVLRGWFVTEMRKRPQETRAWFRMVTRHKRHLARLALAGAVVEVLPAWARDEARLRMTGDKTPEIRALWIQAVALYGEEKTAGRILTQSRSKFVTLREAAVRALDLLAPDHPGTRARFLNGFGSESAVEVALAAREAGRQQSDATAGKLWSTLRSPYWEARAQAVESLALVRTRRSVEVLVKALPDLNLDMRARCLRSLARLTGTKQYSVRAWQEWWLRNLDVRPTPEEDPAAAEPILRGRVEALPPEGRRFTVFCFLPAASRRTAAETAGLAKLFFDLAGGVDEEGAVAIRSGGWWSIRGAKVARIGDPSRRVPRLSSRSLFTTRRPSAKYAWPPKAPVIPYLDPLGPVLEVARKNVPTFLKSGLNASADALWRELATVLGTAETESVVLLTSRDIDAVSAERLSEELRRLRWAVTGRPIRLHLAHYGGQPPVHLAGVVEALGGAWMTRSPQDPAAAPHPNDVPKARPRPAGEQAPAATVDTGWIEDRHGKPTADWAPSGDLQRARAHYTSKGEVVVEVDPAHPHTWSDLLLRIYVDLDDASKTKGHGKANTPRALESEAWSKVKSHTWFGADACVEVRLQHGGRDKPPQLSQQVRLTHGKTKQDPGLVETSLAKGRIHVVIRPWALGSSIVATRTIGLRVVMTGINNRRFAAALPPAPEGVTLDRLPGFRPKETRIPIPEDGVEPGYGQGLHVELFAMRGGDRAAWRVHADPRTTDWASEDDLLGRLSTLVQTSRGGSAGYWAGREYARAPAEVLAASIQSDDQTLLARFPGAEAQERIIFLLNYATTDRWPDTPAGGVRLQHPK